jgi:hypothetical protein
MKPSLLLGTQPKGLTSVRASDTLYHTAIIGQSGSGKSYFLSRYLEEIILRTRARVIIVDPNGDFEHFYLPQSKDNWPTKLLEPLRTAIHSGALTASSDFDSQKEFAAAWLARKFHMISGSRQFGLKRGEAVLAPLMLHWKWLEWEQDFLLDVNESSSASLYQGINTCIKFAVSRPGDFPQGHSLEDLEEIASSFGERRLPVGDWPEAISLSEEDWLATRVHFRQLRKRFGRLWYRGPIKGKTIIPSDLTNYIHNGFRFEAWQSLVVGLSGLDVNHMHLAADIALTKVWNSSIKSWQYARRQQSNALEEHALQEMHAEQIEDEAASELEDPPDELEEWSDKRVPTFIVIDEAHNFAPEEPVSSLQARVSDKIATIAAEGRKYGLFVVIATQRPTKLRRGLLPECENSAVLRIQSKLERQFAGEALAIPSETIEQVGNFETGDALLSGRWVAAPVKTRFAPARTVIGGGGLDAEFWQTSPS